MGEIVAVGVGVDTGNINVIAGSGIKVVVAVLDGVIVGVNVWDGVFVGPVGNGVNVAGVPISDGVFVGLVGDGVSVADVPVWVTR